MSSCLVTGAAGFIGSTLCEQLLAVGHEVYGIDCFTDYYPKQIKSSNLSILHTHPKFTFYELDLRVDDLNSCIQGRDVVFHEAAMAGLMKSWSAFNSYSTCNILGTQRLIEAAIRANTPHFIHISTSSVYGKEATSDESSPLHPISPYGVTKMAAEKLCHAYASEFQLPFTVLRYFSVYGPRQRPDMAYHILIHALLRDQTFTIYGDGTQTRSNTYVSDCVKGTILAFENREKVLGETINIGGGDVVSLNEVIAHIESLTHKTANLIYQSARPGDQKHTSAYIEKATRLLGYVPATRFVDGIKEQVHWQSNLM